MKKYIYTLIIIIFSSLQQVTACTSAIISGKVTTDGKPLLWKNRDARDLNNRLAYFKEGQYEFIGLVNSEDLKNENVWIGCNTTGFSIMDTDANNMSAKDNKQTRVDQDGVLMRKALAVCKNLKDFEMFLDSAQKPLNVEANLGVIDAQGGGAYYEVNNYTWTKYDVNDPIQAPHGYLIRSNYAFSGIMNEGMGYVRYDNAAMMLSLACAENNLTPEVLFGKLSRQFYNSVFDYNPVQHNQYPQWLVDQDYIPRYLTTASMIIQGVRKGEDPRNAILWTVLGYPPCSIVFPVSMRYPDLIPSILKSSDKSNNALLCDMSLKLKQKVFPIKRGKGEMYLRYNLLYNSENTGIIQQINKTELNIIKKERQFMSQSEKDAITRSQVDQFYQSISAEIIEKMQLLNNTVYVPY